MKQLDASFENQFNALKQTISSQELDAVETSRQELNYISDGLSEDALIHDNKKINEGLRSDYKKYTGKDFFKNSILLLILITSLAMNDYFVRNLDLHDNYSILQVDETKSAPPTEIISGNTPGCAEKEKLREPQKNQSNSNYLANQSILIMDSVLINTHILDNKSQYLIYYTGHGLKDKEDRPCNLDLIWSACITQPQKTGLHIKKGMVFFISSDGTIYSPTNNFNSTAEGNTSNQINNNWKPLIKEYNTGALLYKLGEDDNWKSYSPEASTIIADKDGVLEFLINLKNPELIIGNYAVSVFAHQFLQDK